MLLHGHDRPFALRPGTRTAALPASPRSAPVLRAAHSSKQLELPFFSRPEPAARRPVAAAAMASADEPVPDPV
jgi:hypothetical protein